MGGHSRYGSCDNKGGRSSQVRVLCRATTRGPLPSYIGSNTRQKKSISPVVLVNPYPMDKTALAVAELSSWLDLGENLQELLSTLIQDKTMTPVDVVKESASRIVGGLI